MRSICATLIILFCTSSVQAQDCEADARAAMLDVAHPLPMRQDVVTEMAGQKIKSIALSTPDRRGMALDANEKPVSLWQGGKFFTSSDGGKNWKLVSEQSEDQLKQQDENRAKQAEMATDFNCDYGVDLEGKTVNRLQLSYRMIDSGIPVTSQYWVDVENGFPLKIVHEFGGNTPSTITQKNTPQPDLVIPQP